MIRLHPVLENFVDHGTDDLILKSLSYQFPDDTFIEELVKSAASKRKKKLQEKREARQEETPQKSEQKPIQSAPIQPDPPEPESHQNFVNPDHVTPAGPYGKVLVLRLVQKAKSFLQHFWINPENIKKGDKMLTPGVQLPSAKQSLLGFHNLDEKSKQILNTFHKVKDGHIPNNWESICDSINGEYDSVYPTPSITDLEAEDEYAKRARQNRYKQKSNISEFLLGKVFEADVKARSGLEHRRFTITGFNRHFLDRLDLRKGWNKLGYMVKILKNPLFACVGVYEDNDTGKKGFDKTTRFASLTHSVVLGNETNRAVTYYIHSLCTMNAIKRGWRGHLSSNGGYISEAEYNAKYEEDLKRSVEQAAAKVYSKTAEKNKYNETVDKLFKGLSKVDPANYETFDPEYDFMTDFDNLDTDNMRSLFDIEAAIKRGFLRNRVNPNNIQRKSIEWKEVKQFNKRFLEEYMLPQITKNKDPYMEYNPDRDPANFDIPLADVISGKVDPLNFHAKNYPQYRRLKKSEIATKYSSLDYDMKPLPSELQIRMFP